MICHECKAPVKNGLYYNTALIAETQRCVDLQSKIRYLERILEAVRDISQSTQTIGLSGAKNNKIINLINNTLKE